MSDEISEYDEICAINKIMFKYDEIFEIDYISEQFSNLAAFIILLYNFNGPTAVYFSKCKKKIIFLKLTKINTASGTD